MSFESGTTIRIVVSVKDFSGNPTDPDDAPRVSIWDGSHVKRVDSQPMVSNPSLVSRYQPFQRCQDRYVKKPE